MPSRSYILQSAYIDKIKECDGFGLRRDETIEWEIIHMISSARNAFILAEERGIDPDFAACACTVHDFGRVLTGAQAGHAEAGYEPVKIFLKDLAIFSEDEIEHIALAVKNHSNKGEKGSPVEEIVKDADILDMYMFNMELPRKEQRNRLEKLRG